MSEDPDFTKNEPQTIYVELLDEGVACVRPTRGQPLGSGRFRVLPTPDYDPADETWQFPPGTVVTCRLERWDEKEIFVAREIVKE